MAEGAPRSGPVAALRRVAETLLTMGQTRLQLLGTELQIAKHHALGQLVRALLAVVLLALALLLGIGLLLALWWEQRIAILSGLLVLSVLGAAWLAASLRRSNQAQEHPFAGSLVALQEDLEQLRAATRDAPR